MGTILKFLPWNLLIGLLLALGSSDANAKIFIVNDQGIEVEIMPEENPYSAFQKTFSYEKYEKLTQIERQYALPEALIASMNPALPLSSEQKKNLQMVLTQHFDTLPDQHRTEIINKSLWISMLGNLSGVTENLAKKFLPPYPSERTDRICQLARNLISMVASTASQETGKELVNILPESAAKSFQTLVNGGPPLVDRKCPLGKNDTEPLSLKEISQELAKKMSAPISSLNSSPTSKLKDNPTLKTSCKLSEVASLFNDAIANIIKNGTKHKVYLGVSKMTCPIYGLVIQDPKGQFRFFPDSYRSDLGGSIPFSSGEDFASKFSPLADLKVTIPVNKTGAK